MRTMSCCEPRNATWSSWCRTMMAPPLDLDGSATHERPEHVVGLLRVLVRQEELPRRVNEQVMELRTKLPIGAEPELATELAECRAQRPLPGGFIEVDLGRGDLPGVAHGRIEKSPVFVAVAGWLRDTTERLRLCRRDRQVELPHTRDPDSKRSRRQGVPSSERRLPTNFREDVRQHHRAARPYHARVLAERRIGACAAEPRGVRLRRDLQVRAAGSAVRIARTDFLRGRRRTEEAPSPPSRPLLSDRRRQRVRSGMRASAVRPPASGRCVSLCAARRARVRGAPQRR